MSNFSQRLITGTVYILLIILSLIFNPVFFGFLTALFTFIAIGEFVKMASPGINRKDLIFNQLINSILILISVGMIHFNMNSYFIFLAGLIMTLCLFIKALFQKNNGPVQNLSVNILALIYITLPLVLINLVSVTSKAAEIPFVLIMFVIIWTNDTFAYLFGMAFGKHKIFERISPKKSWEGFIGGIIMVVAATVILNYLYPSFGHDNWVIFSLITAIPAVLGDFIESMFKRTYGVKDSGSIMPGHGGILDRIDSLLLAAPFVYIFLNFISK